MNDFNFLSAHYVFNGNEAIKQAVIEYGDNRVLSIESGKNQITERGKMMFVNGIISPMFLDFEHFSGIKISPRIVVVEFGDDFPENLTNVIANIKGKKPKEVIKWLYQQQNTLDNATIFPLLKTVTGNITKFCSPAYKTTIEPGYEGNFILIEGINLQLLRFTDEEKIRILS